MTDGANLDYEKPDPSGREARNPRPDMVGADAQKDPPGERAETDEGDEDDQAGDEAGDDREEGGDREDGDAAG